MKEWKFKPKEPWITWVELGNGVTFIYAFAKNWTCPLAHVWGRHVGGDKGKFDVLHSYTIPFARRCGLRALINDTIFDKFEVDVIMTGEGSEDGGSQFMEAYGYKRNKELGIWFITKEMRTKAENKLKAVSRG